MEEQCSSGNDLPGTRTIKFLSLQSQDFPWRFEGSFFSRTTLSPILFPLVSFAENILSPSVLYTFFCIVECSILLVIL